MGSLCPGAAHWAGRLVWSALGNDGPPAQFSVLLLSQVLLPMKPFTFLTPSSVCFLKNTTGDTSFLVALGGHMASEM